MKSINLSLLVASLFLHLFLGNLSAASAKTCSYNPASGKPNPLGMRTFITLKEKGRDTIAVFEQFPSNVAENITIANKREMMFYNTNIEKARQLLLRNPQYYSELVGYEDSDGFAPINAVLSCK